MITIVLARSGLARVRFAHAPVEELVASLRVLHDPRRQHMSARWLSSVRGQLGGLRLALLTALAPTGRYLPSFLLAPPGGPWGALADQLDAIAVTPPASVRAELDKVRHGEPLPTVLRMEQFASGGLARVLTGLHPDITFERDLLQIDKARHCRHHVDLAGTGILLMPYVFTERGLASTATTWSNPR
jgi:hypothetical protein